MKTIKGKLQHLALLLAAGLTLAGAGTAAAQHVSPVGTWDVVISGKANGVATLMFAEPNQLCGVQITTPTGSGSDDPNSTRYTGSEPGRYPTGSGTNDLSSGKVLYGYNRIEGWWSFDSGGKVVGSFPEISQRYEAKTVSFQVTNVVTGEVTTTTADVTELTYFTNAVSFSAKVVANKRLTMTAYSGIGKVNHRGIPLTALTNVSYPLLGETKRGGQTFYEAMRLQPGYQTDACVPSYNVCGIGPTYAFSGVALISNQKRMALTTSWQDTSETASETVARSVTGSFNSTKFTGNLKGIEDPNFKVKLKLSPLLYGSPPLPCDEED